MIDLSKEFHPVPKNPKSVEKKKTTMKKQSSKQAKMERDRDKGREKSRRL